MQGKARYSRASITQDLLRLLLSGRGPSRLPGRLTGLFLPCQYLQHGRRDLCRHLLLALVPRFKLPTLTADKEGAVSIAEQ